MPGTIRADSDSRLGAMVLHLLLLLPLLLSPISICPLAALAASMPAQQHYGGVPVVPDNIKRQTNETTEASIQLIQNLGNRTHYVNEKVSILCDIVGSPTPKYAWLKDGVRLPDSDRGDHLVQEVTLFGAQLKIDKVGMSDAGLYTCTGENEAGRRATTAYVRVRPGKRPRKRKKRPDDETSDLDDDGQPDDKPPRLPVHSSVVGFCQEFRPTVCLAFIGKASSVFVTSNTYQYSMERQLVRLLGKMADLADINEECAQPLTEAICRYNFPLCSTPDHDGGASPRRLCASDCNKVTRDGRCRRHMETLRTSLSYLRDQTNGGSNVDFLSLLPDCRALPNDGQCVRLGGGSGDRSDSNPDAQEPPPRQLPPPPLLPQPPVQQPPPPSSRGDAGTGPDCYNGTGRGYSGPASRGLSGRPCLPWSDFTGYEGLGGVGRCRNPDGPDGRRSRFDTPWCFVGPEAARESCGVLACGGGSGGRIRGGDGVLGVGGAVSTGGSSSGTGSGGGGLSPVSGREMLPVFVSLGVLAALAVGLLLVCCFCRRASPSTGSAGYQGMIMAVGMVTAQQQQQQQQRQQHQLNHHSSEKRLLQQHQSMPGLNGLHKAKEFSLSQIRFGEELGESAFGRVYKGELIGLHSETSLTPVVIKCLSTAADARTRAEFLRDAASRAELRHPGLVCLLGAALTQQPLVQVQETLPHGDLHEFLIYHSPASDRSCSQQDYSDPLTTAQMLHVAAQVSAGLDYLAGRGLDHRDVAARNVLLGDSLQCKLGDLGAVRDLYSCDYYRVQDRCRLPIRWLPPEAILYGQFSPQSDVHSFGVLLWELWSYGLQPYYGYSNSEVIELVRQRQLLPRPPDCPAQVATLLLECWSEAPTQRPSAAILHERLRLWHSDLLAEQAQAAAASKAAPAQRVIPVPVPPPLQPPQAPLQRSRFSSSSISSSGGSSSSGASDDAAAGTAAALALPTFRRTGGGAYVPQAV